MEKLARHIESLIFVAKESISVKELKYNLEAHFNADFSIEEIENMISLLMDRYSSDFFSIEIVNISGGYKFLTKPAFHGTVGTYLKNNSKKKLSKAAMEVLSIIAYKQPIPKSEVEFIRGVNCDYTVHKLLEKGLLDIAGRDDGPGRPILYGTSEKFMDYFGLKDINDLPKPKEFKIADTEAGSAVSIEEEVVVGGMSEE